MTGPLFLIPPLMDPTRLAPDVLVGAATCLATNGDVCDANALCHEYLIGATHLENRRDALAPAAQIDPGTVTAQEALDYYRYLKACLFTGRGAWHDPSAMLKDLCDPSINPKQRDQLRLDVERGLDTAFAPYWANVRLNDVTARHSTESSHDLIAAAKCTDTPFRAFWSYLFETDKKLSAPIWIIRLDRDQQLIPLVTLLDMLATSETIKPQVFLTGPVAALLAARGPDVLRGRVAGCYDSPDAALLAAGHNPGTPQENHIDDALRHLGRGHDPQSITVMLEAKDFPLSPVLQTGRARQLKLHIETPLAAAVLEERALEMGAGRQWSATLGYGQTPCPDAFCRLADVGMRCIQFEVKGFAGHADSDCARKAIAQGFENARDAGLRVLVSLVYGFPGDSPDAFDRFVLFLSEQIDKIDRIVTVRLYRVLIGSPQQLDPQTYGISGIDPVPDTYDLARSCHFTTNSGFDSKTFSKTATGALATIAAPEPHFPATVLAIDQADFGTAHESPEQKPFAVSALGPDDRIVQADDITVAVSKLDFAKLDAAFRTWMPRPGGGLPDDAINPKRQAVIRNRTTGKISHIPGGMAKILVTLSTPNSLGELSKTLGLPLDKLSIACMKLVDAGIIQILPSKDLQPARLLADGQGNTLEEIGLGK